MENEPYWLTPEDIVAINRLVVESTGEPFFLRDETLLEGAAHSPQNRFYYGGEQDAVALAITLLFAVARNHPFERGNKRTAFEAALIFLLANGYEWDAPDDTYFAQAIIDVLEHQMSVFDFTTLFEAFVRALPQDEGGPIDDE